MKAIHLQSSKLNPQDDSVFSGNPPDSTKGLGIFDSSILLLRRLVNKFGKLVNKIQKLVNKLGNRVLGLHSYTNYNALWRRSRTFHKFINATTITSSVLLTLLGISIIIPIYNNIDKTNAATNEQTAPTLTLNITNDTASLDLVVMDSDGTFASSSTSGSNSTFTVATNNFTGYTLSIKSSGSSTDLTNVSTNPNSILETISSSMDSNTFDDKNYNGKWGYLPSKYNSSANTTTYYPSPTTTGTTLDKTSTANSTANSYTIAIGARADYSKPTGAYSNTYILTTVINGFDYSIAYNKGNTTDVVSNLPNTQTASATSDSSITLSSTEPTRDGYAFTGWCSIIPTTSSGTDSCSGDTYASGATYYFNKTSDNSSITLYAMWEEEKVYMQDLTFAECPSTVAKVYDKRDEKDYQIVKITHDGKSVCWMVQNLRYVGDGIGSSTSLSTTTSNVSANKSITFHDLTSGSDYSDPRIHDSGDTTYGVWYNFAAASAGYITGGSNDSNSSYDICPKNWHLPTGAWNTSGADGYTVFQNTSYGSWIPMSGASIPLQSYFNVTGGHYDGGTLTNASMGGVWWSATANGVTNRYDLYHNASDGFVSSSGNRYYGYYIRCVMTPPTINDITYLQEVTQSMVSQMSVGDTVTLKDKRDGQSYAVGKLIDDNLWLLDNLRLGGTTLTEAMSINNTNMSNNGFTLPSSGSINAYDTEQINATYYNSRVSYGSGNTTYGVYYNYCAASAGTYCMTGGSGSGNASDDICPYGWRMPTGGASGEYQTLYRKYNNWENFRSAFHAPFSGGLVDRSAFDQHVYGNFWSSTYGGTYSMYILFLDGDNNDVTPAHTSNRYYGLSVRCILRTTS